MSAEADASEPMKVSDLPAPATKKKSKIKLSPRAKAKPDIEKQAAEYLEKEVATIVNGGTPPAPAQPASAPAETKAAPAAVAAEDDEGVRMAVAQAPKRRSSPRPQAKAIADEEGPAASAAPTAGQPDSAGRTDGQPLADERRDTVPAKDNTPPKPSSGSSRRPSRALPFSPRPDAEGAPAGGGASAPKRKSGSGGKLSMRSPRSMGLPTTPRGTNAALEGMTLVQLCELKKQHMFTDAEFAAIKAQLLAELDQ